MIIPSIGSNPTAEGSLYGQHSPPMQAQERALTASQVERGDYLKSNVLPDTWNPNCFGQACIDIWFKATSSI